jgi:hypothetical protein
MEYGKGARLQSDMVCCGQPSSTTRDHLRTIPVQWDFVNVSCWTRSPQDSHSSQPSSLQQCRTERLQESHAVEACAGTQRSSRTVRQPRTRNHQSLRENLCMHNQYKLTSDAHFRVFSFGTSKLQTQIFSDFVCHQPDLYTFADLILTCAQPL